MPFSSADPNAYVALAMQSGLGALNTTPSKYRFVKYSSGNTFDIDQAVTYLREGGDGLDYGAAYKGRQVARGQIVMNIRPEAGGQLLAAVVGAATWNGGSSPALHRFLTSHASYPWSSLQVAHPGTDLVNVIRDVRFTGFTLAGRTGQPLTLTAPYLGIFSGASSAIALVPSYPLADDFFVYHFSPSIILDGSADSTVEEWSIDGRFGIDELQAQSVNLDEAVVMNREFQFRAVRRYESSTLWKKVAYNGGVMPTSGLPTTAFSAFYAIPGSPSRSLRVEANLIVPNDNTLAALDPNGVTVRETITGTLLRHASGTLHVTLEGVHASAYAS